MSRPNQTSRFIGTCPCGARIEAIQDCTDPDKFYFECLKCGLSATLHRDKDYFKSKTLEQPEA